MTSGYTPLFQTVLEGTLFGKWPHTGIWTCLLSQCDKHGEIDQHPALLAAKIGVPVELLLQCITDFMAPDPASRTGDMEGRRLELIDSASREWGWKVINHSIYREKARKQVYDKERTESGRDAQRKQENRPPAKSRVVPRSPALSRSQTHTSDTDNKSPPATPEVAAVFDHWKATHDHPRSQLDVKRTKVIRLALKVYTPEQLCLAISGYKNSAYHMGQNDSHKKFDDIELFLRDAKRIDAGLEYAEKGQEQKWQ